MGSGPASLATKMLSFRSRRQRATQEEPVPRQVENGAKRIQHQHQRGESRQLPAVVQGKHPVVQQEHVRRPCQGQHVDPDREEKCQAEYAHSAQQPKRGC